MYDLLNGCIDIGGDLFSVDKETIHIEGDLGRVAVLLDGEDDMGIDHPIQVLGDLPYLLFGKGFQLRRHLQSSSGYANLHRPFFPSKLA